MEEYTGSIVLKRLKKGITVLVALRTDGAALYQGFDSATQTPRPDFTVAANQPVVTPEAMAGNGRPCKITSGQWSYNGIILVMDTTSVGDGFYKCTDVRFAINPVTYALKIIGNIASADNVSNDTLTFACSGEVDAQDFEQKTSTEIHLQNIGASGCALYITGGCTIVSSSDTVPLTAHFFVGGDEMGSGYTYKWYTEGGKVLQNTTSRTYTVKADDVTAVGGIYCSAIKTGTSDVLATDFHKMTDLGDSFELVATVDKEWDGDNAQTITVVLYRFVAGQKGEAVSLSGKTVKHVFATSEKNVQVATKTGVTVSVGTDVWSSVPSDEGVIDFITVNA